MKDQFLERCAPLREILSQEQNKLSAAQRIFRVHCRGVRRLPTRKPRHCGRLAARGR
jgi:hypothetical protein